MQAESNSKANIIADAIISSIKMDSLNNKSTSTIHKESSVESLNNLPRNPTETYQNPNVNEAPKSPYNAVSHKIRKLVPEEIACKVGCSGEKCKYCNSNWPSDDMALKGVFSHWITQDILAMARPTTRLINDCNLVKQMKDKSIKSLFNLQLIDEHKYCGKPLEKSGFSYDPNVFLENGFYYYNFGFQDYSIASMPKMIDMVKVLSFAVQQGKVAVHCHAGLGRTGLFIACYLIYSFRMSANDAIFYIRKQRRKAVQMKHQIQAIQEFEKFLTPLRVIFANTSIHFTLSTFVHRQRYFLHGYEARTLKYIPKIIFVCVERLIEIIKKEINDQANKQDLRSTPNFENTENIRILSAALVENITDEARKMLINEQESSSNTTSSSTIGDILNALTSDYIGKDSLKRVEYYKNLVNDKDDGLDKLSKENDVNILIAIIMTWTHHLKIPILDEQEINVLMRSMYVDEQGENMFKWTDLDRCTLQTIDCVLNLYRCLIFDSKKVTPELEFNLIRKLISVLTQTEIPVSDSVSVTSLKEYETIEEEDLDEQQSTFYETTPTGGGGARGANNSNNKRKYLNNSSYLKKHYIGILYQAIHTLIRKPTSVKVHQTPTSTDHSSISSYSAYHSYRQTATADPTPRS